MGCHVKILGLLQTTQLKCDFIRNNETPINEGIFMHKEMENRNDTSRNKGYGFQTNHARK